MVKFIPRRLPMVRVKVRPTRSVTLLVVQLAGAGAVLAGIAQWSVPSALIVGGVVAVAAAERQPR